MFRLKAEGAGAAEAPPAPTLAKRIPHGTDQQEALWAELVGGQTHAVVQARAGCGKSSSCREGMHRMLEARPGQLVRYAVFNKANADEFRAQCPPGVDVGTVHSFGFLALKKAYSSQIEKNKTYLLLDESREGRQLPRYMRKSIAVLVGHAKNAALAPGGCGLYDELVALMRRMDVNAYGRPQVVARWAEDVLARSAEWTQVVDFDDMIWLPGLQQLEFPPCDVLFLDEVQDWNPAQRRLVPMLCRSGRVVAVGDPYQAVYVWRGADQEGMANLERQLAGAGQVKEFPLTVTFRCPKRHVALAQAYVPDFTAHESNREGTIVETDDPSCVVHARPGDKVICPTNAPVIAAALKAVAARRRVVVKGRAVGDQLVAVVRGCGDCRTVADLAKAVEAWKARELARLSDLDGAEDAVESVGDRAAGLQAVLATVGAPAEVEPAISALFAESFSDDAINFSTIHRAKGAEAERVYLLDAPTRAPRQDWEKQQARNLRYVALTRSKDALTLIQPGQDR